MYGTATNQTLIIQQIKAECMVNPTERHGKWWEKNGGQIDDRDKENDERPVEEDERNKENDERPVEGKSIR